MVSLPLLSTMPSSPSSSRPSFGEFGVSKEIIPWLQHLLLQWQLYLRKKLYVDMPSQAWFWHHQSRKMIGARYSDARLSLLGFPESSPATQRHRIPNNNRELDCVLFPFSQ